VKTIVVCSQRIKQRNKKIKHIYIRFITSKYIYTVTFNVCVPTNPHVLNSLRVFTGITHGIWPANTTTPINMIMIQASYKFAKETVQEQISYEYCMILAHLCHNCCTVLVTIALQMPDF